MRDWLGNVAGEAYATAMLWTFGALVLLLVVLLLIKIVRSLTFGTFVSGGRHRKARLAVMDAAAVDSHRRLVLVRRDDVEHLLLIGGPTDVVVEQNIRLSPAQRRPAEEAPREHAAPPAEELPQPAPAQVHVPAPAQPAIVHVAPAPRSQPAPTPLRPVPQPVAAAPVAPPRPAFATAPAAPRPVQQAPARPVAPVPPAAANTPHSPDLDEALREELEISLDRSVRHEPHLPESVEDEMSRLLDDLTPQRR